MEKPPRTRVQIYGRRLHGLRPLGRGKLRRRKNLPDRRLLAAEGKTIADGYGYLAATQTRDGRIQLITSKDHYAFNLAWIKATPPEPRK